MLATGVLVTRPPGQLQVLIVSRSLKRKVAIGAAALAGAAFGGGAYAATQSTTNPRQAFLDDAAKRLHVTPQQLKSALGGAAIDQLSAAVKAGKLTQAQANAIKRRIQQGGGPPFGPWIGPRPFLHHLAFGGPLNDGPLAAAAKYLGLTDAQLSKQLMSGKSLAQIAQAQHKSVSGLQSAVQASVKARLDKAVAAGFLTKAQEQRILSRISDIVTRKIERPGFGPRFHGGPGLRFHGRFRGGPPPGAPPLPAPGGYTAPAGPPPVTF